MTSSRVAWMNANALHHNIPHRIRGSRVLSYFMVQGGFLAHPVGSKNSSRGMNLDMASFYRSVEEIAAEQSLFDERSEGSSRTRVVSCSLACRWVSSAFCIPSRPFGYDQVYYLFLSG